MKICVCKAWYQGLRIGEWLLGTLLVFITPREDCVLAMTISEPCLDNKDAISFPVYHTKGSWFTSRQV